MLEGDLTLEQDFISEIIELNEEMDALGSLKDLHDLKKSNIREIENILKYFLNFLTYSLNTMI